MIALEEMKYEVGNKRRMRTELNKLLDTMHFNEYIAPKPQENIKNIYHDMFELNESFITFGVDGIFFVHPYCLDYSEYDDIPNFYYDKTGLKISWHKVPFRDAKANKIITIIEWKRIIDDCMFAANVIKEDVFRRI